MLLMGSGSSSYVKVLPNKFLFGVRLKFLCEAGCVLRNAYLGSGSSPCVRQGVPYTNFSIKAFLAFRAKLELKIPNFLGCLIAWWALLFVQYVVVLSEATVLSSLLWYNR